MHFALDQDGRLHGGLRLLFPIGKTQDPRQAHEAVARGGSCRKCEKGKSRREHSILHGAAWRELGNKKKAFGEILEMVSRVNAEGLEVCATLGMLNPEQAKQLKEAGLLTPTTTTSTRLGNFIPP